MSFFSFLLSNIYKNKFPAPFWPLLTNLIAYLPPPPPPPPLLEKKKNKEQYSVGKLDIRNIIPSENSNIVGKH